MHKTITTCWLALLVLIFMTLGRSDGYAQQRTNSKLSLTDALTTIEKRFNARFAFEQGILDNKFVEQQTLKGSSLEEVLKNVLYPHNLIFLYVSENSYSIVARNASFFTGSTTAGDHSGQPSVTAQSTPLRGTLTDENNEPVAFVSVWVKGTNQATQTNDKGGYLLPLVTPGNVIRFSAVGYSTQEIQYTNQSKLDVRMNTDSKMLNEVAIVNNGYQALPKVRSTGSASTITAKEIEAHPQTNILDRIEGLTPGVQLNLTSGDRGFFYQSGNATATIQGPNAGTRTVGTNDYNINIRGRSSLQGENFPLIVLDGAITELDLSTLNPNDVEAITFLKDAAAASIWGTRAANGVIVVTTKKGKRTQIPAVNFSTSMTVGGRPDLSYYKMMNSSQQLAYEKELVDRNLLPTLGSTDYFNAGYLLSPGTYLAQQLRAGAITQGQYDSQVNSWGQIDSRDQVSKYLLQGAQNQQYNLSVSGGTENSSYFYSASYSRERPYEVRDQGSRLTATFNNNWKLFNWASLSTSVKGSFLNFANNSLGMSDYYRPSRTTLLPYEQLADENGNNISYDRLNPAYTRNLSAVYKDWRYNYLDELSLNDNTQKDNYYSFNINLKVPLFKGLSFSTVYVNERAYSNQRTYNDPRSYFVRNQLNYYTFPTAANNSLGITNGGALSLVNTTLNNYSLRSQLDYDHSFGQKHQLTALAGTEIRETNNGQSTGTLWGYVPQTGLTNIPLNFSSTPTYSYVAGSTATSYTTFSSGYPTQADRQRRFLSYFGNAGYTYDNRYVVTASVRYDDYNNFGLDRSYRATPLWSVGAKWNISREKFFHGQRWIDNLALRGTYGVTGNISLSTLPFTYIALNPSDLTTGSSSASIIAPANPQLRWEKTYVTNVAADFSLFNGRLSGSIDVYRKRSEDLLYAFPISTVYIGNVSNQITRNLASMTGHGIDIGLNGIIWKKADWRIDAGLTFSYNTNKVTNAIFTESLYTTYLGSLPASISYIAGYPTDKVFVYRNAGLDANGLTRIFDRNGAIVPATTTTLSSLEDLQYAGRLAAPYYGGFNTTLHYKSFTLFAQATYQFGNVFLKPSVQNYITSPYTLTNYDLSGDIAQRWTRAGDETNTVVPGLNGTATAINTSLSRYQYSDINVLKGDYVRLRQVTLSYNLPSVLLNKLRIKGAQIGATVNNLGLLWTANKQGYDPDFVSYIGSNRGLPAVRSYTVNLNLNF